MRGPRAAPKRPIATAYGTMLALRQCIRTLSIKIVCSWVPMPRVSQPAVPAYPNLDGALFALNVDDLKWYLGALPGSIPTRKPELVAALKQALTDPATLQALWARLTPVQQQVVAEVVHHLGGQYNAGLIEAKYPG